MAELPHLLLPTPVRVDRRALSGFGPTATLPGYRRQGARLQGRFQDLTRASGAASAAPGTAEPEELVVLETVGRVDDLARAISRVPGMEWLGDLDIDELAPEPEFGGGDGADQQPDGSISPGRLYLVMSSQGGIDELLRLWRLYTEGGDRIAFPYGLTRWREVFARLNNIRRWGPEDRVRETGLAEDVALRGALGQQVVGIEVELWYREQPAARRAAVAAIAALVGVANGTVGREALVAGAAYHALLAYVPIETASDIATAQHPVVRAPQVRFIRPVGQALFRSGTDQSEPHGYEDGAKPTGDPVIALLDGLPLPEHVRLTQRILIDDPDDWAAEYPADQRHHGTSMASLIVHGDIKAEGAPLKRPLYARPVLRPTHMGLDEWREQVPDDELPADLIDRAVSRLFESNNDRPVAPSIRVICHALADPSRPFDGSMSAWARVVDYLSWRYRVLFVLSAGNHPGSIDLPPAIGRADPAQLEQAVLNFLATQGRVRRLLAPAESINGVTVGSLHDDASGAQAPTGTLEPYVTMALPSPVSAQGRGFRRSIKPDLAMSGGRQTYFAMPATNTFGLTVNTSVRPPGQLSAAPPVTPGELERVAYTRGTSNATALAARLAAMTANVVEEIRAARGAPPAEFDSVILKAMLAHSSERVADDRLQALFGADGQSLAVRLTGYGRPDETRTSSSDDDRVLMIGWGDLGDGQGHRFQWPIPSGLSGITAQRIVTATLAWFTPINPRHSAYRRAQLWFDPYGVDDADGFQSAMRLHRIRGADWQRVRRGTLQHEVFVGDAVITVDPDAMARLQVNCRSETGDLVENVPYALVVTMEARSQTTLRLYQEISSRLAVTTPVAIQTR
jgi:hypothetical protein